MENDLMGMPSNLMVARNSDQPRALKTSRGAKPLICWEIFRLCRWILSRNNVSLLRLSRERGMMLKTTDAKQCSWHILSLNEKKKARLNCIEHILRPISYGKIPEVKIKLEVG
jgi:polyphosphate kinase 2 (PPK2 family)